MGRKEKTPGENRKQRTEQTDESRSKENREQRREKRGRMGEDSHLLSCLPVNESLLLRFSLFFLLLPANFESVEHDWLT